MRCSTIWIYFSKKMHLFERRSEITFKILWYWARLKYDGADVLMLMLKKEMQIYLRKAIGSLKPDEQQIIISNVYFEMSSTEIADVMGMNASTVRIKLMRSLEK